MPLFLFSKQATPSGLRAIRAYSSLSMDQHNRSVERIAGSIRQFYQNGETFRVQHGSTNSTRPRRHNRVVDISDLSNVLKIDVEKQIALVEPNVPMDRLVEATLPFGLVPPVVMEFPGITAGGGYAGTAGESSSFKHGFFDRTINSVEMVLANGYITTASETENADLFRGAAGAVGTLGITTLLELQLIPATKYVKATYHPRRSVADTIKLVEEETHNPINDYVDGIIFSKDHGVIITGTMTNEKPADVQAQTFSRTTDPWYYLHVKGKTRNATSPVTEYIPLAEYLFRYDRGGFWVGTSAFDYFRFPFNKLTRWFLDDFLHTRMLYRALHASSESSRYIVQDLALPYSTAESFVDYTSEAFGIFPLWLCPLKQSPQPTMHPHSDQMEGSSPKNMLNIGLWGFGPADYEEFISKNRELEQQLFHKFGGMKWLYAHTYYTEEDFWQQFDKKWYDDLREKYHAQSLPSVYDKVAVDVEAGRKEIKESWSHWVKSIRPLGGLWGIYKAIKGREYMVARKSTWREH
ncbi:delta24-sterol reductase [[Emmonsia] crescens]|uniref:Delta(24)-sterol reductase n=1 Tax=[Emmonsia] crescens TaxID=73230 RepID=A0A0G2HYH1_9EURO|nr:delta24-sterol reductase [Emmonsia crescens UAMH 3008]